MFFFFGRELPTFGGGLTYFFSPVMERRVLERSTSVFLPPPTIRLQMPRQACYECFSPISVTYGCGEANGLPVRWLGEHILHYVRLLRPKKCVPPFFLGWESSSATFPSARGREKKGSGEREKWEEFHFLLLPTPEKRYSPKR